MTTSAVHSASPRRPWRTSNAWRTWWAWWSLRTAWAGTGRCPRRTGAWRCQWWAGTRRCRSSEQLHIIDGSIPLIFKSSHTLEAHTTTYSRGNQVDRSRLPRISFVASLLPHYLIVHFHFQTTHVSSIHVIVEFQISATAKCNAASLEHSFITCSTRTRCFNVHVVSRETSAGPRARTRSFS